MRPSMAGLRRRCWSLTVLALFAILLFSGTAEAQASQPAPAGTPDWLSFQGETRMRYETLDGQFRAGRSAGDQLLLFRTLLLSEVRAHGVSLGLEFQDSRTYLGDSGTPLSTSIANPLDVLQAYVGVDLPGLQGEGSRTTLKLGRQTVSIGSKRQIERVEFANVIKNYTGLHLTHSFPGGDGLHLVYVAPLARKPTERARLDENELSRDREQWNRRIWGVHYIRKELAPGRWPGVSGELFVYGLAEEDSGEFPTPNRSYVTPGFRLYRPRASGRWNFDIEGALRYGSRRASSAPDDTRDLDVGASMLRAEVGYTVAAPWKPNLALQYYWASGDEDPNDGRYDQYDRLFGGRRTDLNHTSIHGPLTPANLNAPGFRVEVQPNSRMDARLTYSAAHLASGTDRWIIAGLQDPTGASGTFIGHALDARTRLWILPGRLQMEIGFSAFIFGEFARNVPEGPAGRRTLFGYSQLLLIL